jgi:hypothetical protein
MKKKASARSAALLAVGVLLGFASSSYGATGTSGAWPAVQQATSDDTRARADMQVVASDELNDVDRAVSAPTQAAASATTPQPDTQSQSMVPVVASSDESSGWDTSALIGKILIGLGTLLTLGSAARMLMT